MVSKSGSPKSPTKPEMSLFRSARSWIEIAPLPSSPPPDAPPLPPLGVVAVAIDLLSRTKQVSPRLAEILVVLNGNPIQRRVALSVRTRCLQAARVFTNGCLIGVNCCIVCNGSVMLSVTLSVPISDFVDFVDAASTAPLT